MVSLVHVVDELDALALILERRIREGRPSVVLTLIFAGRPMRIHCKSYFAWSISGDKRGDFRNDLLGKWRNF